MAARPSDSLFAASQWGVVVAYVALLVTPALLPLPQGAAHIWTNVTLFAQFVFWGALVALRAAVDGAGRSARGAACSARKAP